MVLGLVCRHAHHHEEVGRVAGRRKHAAALRGAVHRALVVPVGQELVNGHGPQPDDGRRLEQHFWRALTQQLGVGIPGAALQVEAMDVDAILGAFLDLVRVHAAHDKVIPNLTMHSGSEEEGEGKAVSECSCVWKGGQGRK
eukprot:362156-Chlamydomonas_euryale.AAC.26